MGAALAPRPGAGAVDMFIEIAAAHGARRRVQGVHEACLFEEYDFLGAAVPHALRECLLAPLPPEDMLALEGALTTAILAGLRGYHRGEFERRGTWADALARTANDSRRSRDRRRRPETRQSAIRRSSAPDWRRAARRTTRRARRE